MLEICVVEASCLNQLLIVSKGKQKQQQHVFNLKVHLAQYNVGNRVYSLLSQESITVDELLTFRTKDLDAWCDEHSKKQLKEEDF